MVANIVTFRWPLLVSLSLHAGMVMLPLMQRELPLVREGDSAPTHVQLVSRVAVTTPMLAGATSTPKPIKPTSQLSPTPKISLQSSPAPAAVVSPRVETISASDLPVPDSGADVVEAGDENQHNQANKGHRAGTGLHEKGLVMPEVVTRVAPQYPEVAIRRGMQGVAVFRVQVLPSGQCGDIKLLQSSGYAMLDNVAKKTLKFWQFSPARYEEVPTAFWVEIPVEFVLKDSV